MVSSDASISTMSSPNGATLPIELLSDIITLAAAEDEADARPLLLSLCG